MSAFTKMKFLTKHSFHLLRQIPICRIVQGLTSRSALFSCSLHPNANSRRAGIRFRDSIKVAVDIRCGAHVAMSEPFLDLLHWHTLGEKHRGAGVAQIVESDLLQVMFLQKLSKVSGDEVGTEQPLELQNL